MKVALGDLEWGGFFYVLSGFCDFLDGQVARRGGKVSEQGGILDSFLDRISDAFVLGGTLFFYRMDPLPFLLALSALIVSFLIPYLRAKGEAVGIPMAIGVLQRQERVLILSVAFLLSPLLKEYGLDHPSFPYPLLLISLGIQILLGISTILARIGRIIKK
jgi:phosphatidylglycerophosphate synthase